MEYKESFERMIEHLVSYYKTKRLEWEFRDNSNEYRNFLNEYNKIPEWILKKLEGKAFNSK